ncbi:HAD family hydrolase [Modestobacter sp. VKM Ac-2979]|uniref:HAD family hydrolase n=1 Tax=unclassified Modestobacter TaxID=2643866 RepID=UPI0022ABB505|nr:MULTISPECIES: HAD family hydrolase [unclassified Modestobacter]MCZ2811032.1 HAD family hydrolase [Modestobacter sp. VKM Ac-2979]MCZ2840545.1 HAD family hydrolase [Modestobacter sp. VKM Ac-2980]
MTLPQDLRAVFLDVGGPVYDDENFVVAVLQALDELRADQGRGPVDRSVFRAVYDRIRAEQGGSLRRALATELLGDPELRDALHERTRAHWHHPAGTLYADVLPFLAQLRGRVTVGVLANQERAVVDALTRDGVADSVDVWGVSAIVGHEKPSPELFTWCLTQAGARPEQAVHIGNRLDTDVRPAAALGLGTVWVLRGEAPDEPTPEQLAEPDLAVRSLDGLAARLLAGTAV